MGDDLNLPLPLDWGGVSCILLNVASRAISDNSVVISPLTAPSDHTL